ncbi:histone protein [Streptomyces fuscigenes]|uniref:histone protein n=1 Tax=Streptomyces fuscigenes TaxID=1528880 RepID=UPI001F44763B|nr:histone protein [Streptomyces fuscigenes]MCF3960220.1 histone protein [Streptomyces fuscigenes]
MDSNKTTLAAAILVAYLAGRTKQGKLLLGALSAVVGRGMDPAALIGQGVSKLEQNPLVAELSEKIRGELLDAGRAAVSAATSRGVSSLTDTLQRRTGSLLDSDEEEEENGTSDEDATDEVEDETYKEQEEDLHEEPDEEEEPADEEEGPDDEEEEPEEAEAPEPASSSGHRAARRAEKPTDRKAGPKNPPAKRAMARKAAQRKPGPKNPPAKKAMARKAADSEVAERKAAGRRSGQR